MIIWLLLGCLAGCTSMTQQDLAAPETAPQEIQPLDNWRMQGKLSIRHAGKSRTVTLDWQQADDQSRVLLKGPLGGQLAEIIADPTGLQVDLGDGPAHYSNATKAVNSSQANLVLDVPWGNLRYWVLGLTGQAGTPLPSTFITGQWQVATLRRNPEGRPQLMTFTHPSLTLRLKIKSLHHQSS